MSDAAIEWEPAGPCVALPAGEIHIWRLALDLELPALERYLGMLSPEERQRAKAYPRDLDSFRAIACRGRLREILSLYGAGEPAQIQFSLGPSGKPMLAGGAEPHFNLARCEGQGLLALALDRELGVDLERIRPEVGFESIAESFFTPGEQDLLQAQEPAARPRFFFSCWTLKEACLKAQSQTSLPPLERIDVTRPQADPRWRLQLLDLGPELAASLAFEQDARHAPARLRYLKGAAAGGTLLPEDLLRGADR
jgi:4'-phosphopantetheinyl transferase